eukprot:635397-Amphidinium_carterae.2
MMPAAAAAEEARLKTKGACITQQWVMTKTTGTTCCISTKLLPHFYSTCTRTPRPTVGGCRASWKTLFQATVATGYP